MISKIEFNMSGVLKEEDKVVSQGDIVSVGITLGEGRVGGEIDIAEFIGMVSYHNSGEVYINEIGGGREIVKIKDSSDDIRDIVIGEVYEEIVEEDKDKELYRYKYKIRGICDVSIVVKEIKK